MTTITRFTKEQLIARANHMLCVGKAFLTEHPEYDGMAKDVELFGIALSSLTAEPVAWTDADELRDANNGGSGYLFSIGGDANKFADPRRQLVLYTATPVPGLPDEIRNQLKAEGLADLLRDARDYAPLTSEQWETLTNNWHQTFVGLSGENDACRAAMLQGKASDNSPVIPDCYSLVPVPDEFLGAGQNERGMFELSEDCMCRLAVALSQQSKGMVTPPGYVMVPVEPTIEMLNEFDSIIDYGAEDSKDAWNRLIAAAPQQEVK